MSDRELLELSFNATTTSSNFRYKYIPGKMITSIKLSNFRNIDPVPVAPLAVPIIPVAPLAVPVIPVAVVPSKHYLIDIPSFNMKKLYIKDGVESSHTFIVPKSSCSHDKIGDDHLLVFNYSTESMIGNNIDIFIKEDNGVPIVDPNWTMTLLLTYDSVQEVKSCVIS
jgi:hypothetical protein